MTDHNPDDLVGVNELAEICGVSEPTIRVCRRMNRIPLPAKGGGEGRKMLWRRATVDAWLAAQPPRPPVESDFI